MKNLFISLITLSVLMFFGCQENAITDPVTTAGNNKVNVPDIYKHDIIKIAATLNDPYPIGNSYYIINGQIEYDHRMVAPLPMQPPHKYYVSLSLSTNADLRYFCSVCAISPEDNLAGFITKDSEEYVPLNEHFIALLEKSYIIQGREDGMTLKCRFLVTADGIQLNTMWLTLPKQSDPAASIQ